MIALGLACFPTGLITLSKQAAKAFLIIEDSPQPSTLQPGLPIHPLTNKAGFGNLCSKNRIRGRPAWKCPRLLRFALMTVCYRRRWIVAAGMLQREVEAVVMLCLASVCVALKVGLFAMSPAPCSAAAASIGNLGFIRIALGKRGRLRIRTAQSPLRLALLLIEEVRVSKIHLPYLTYPEGGVVNSQAFQERKTDYGLHYLGM